MVCSRFEEPCEQKTMKQIYFCRFCKTLRADQMTTYILKNCRSQLAEQKHDKYVLSNIVGPCERENYIFISLLDRSVDRLPKAITFLADNGGDAFQIWTYSEMI